MLFERIYIFKYFYHKYKKNHHGLYVIRYSTLKHICSRASDGGFKNIKWFFITYRLGSSFNKKDRKRKYCGDIKK